MTGDVVVGAVDQTVDRLYAAFGGHRLPEKVVMCEHCRALLAYDGMTGHALRDLPPEAVEHLALKLATTWGGADELRALLPRLCELAAAGTVHVPFRAVTAKLRHAGWLGWPTSEQEAIADFLWAVWTDLLSAPAGYHDAGGVLFAISEALDDLHPFLASWHQRTSDEAHPDARRYAIVHLTRFVIGYQNELRFGRIPEQVGVWLRGPTTHIQLDRAVYDYAGTPLGDEARSAAVLALAPP